MNKVSKEKLLMLTGSRCFYCGFGLTVSSCRIEHIVPKSRGGSNRIANLAPSCSICNAKKRDRTIDELRAHVLNNNAVFKITFFFETIGLSGIGEIEGVK